MRMRCHELDYEIKGDDMQMVEVELDPGEAVIAEAGAMNYMEDGIGFEAKMGDGSEPDKGLFGKLLDAGSRKLTGESLFMTHFTNRGTGKKRVAFAAPYPGRIVCLDMAKVGGEILCQKDAFLCAALGTNVGIAFNKRLGSGFFGGEGFILQRLRGDGMAFMHAGGTVIERRLNNERLRGYEWIRGASWVLPLTCTTTSSVRGVCSRCSSVARACSWRRSLARAPCGSRVCRSPDSPTALLPAHRAWVAPRREKGRCWAGSGACLTATGDRRRCPHSAGAASRWAASPVVPTYQ